MTNHQELEKITVSLKTLTSQTEILTDLINSFSCPLNSDVENFLKNNAIRFENTHTSRTYLIFDKNNLSSILAYFSITLKEISLPESISKTQVKKIDGISKQAKTAKGYLIGQIGKNMFPGNPINLSVIFEEIYSIIYQAQELIGGRILFLECEDNQKLINLYHANGFKVLQKKELVMMYRIFKLV